MEVEAGFTIERELAHLPRIAFDREQIAKVVTNLVLNAKEAMSGAESAVFNLARGRLGRAQGSRITDAG